MRTTVTLDRDLERFLRETAVRTHTPFQKVLNDTLRAGIEQSTGMGPWAPFVLKARPMGLRAGHDPAGFNQLAVALRLDAEVHTADLDFGRFAGVRFSNPLV